MNKTKEPRSCNVKLENEETYRRSTIHLRKIPQDTVIQTTSPIYPTWLLQAVSEQQNDVNNRQRSNNQPHNLMSPEKVPATSSTNVINQHENSQTPLSGFSEPEDVWPSPQVSPLPRRSLRTRKPVKKLNL